MSKKVLAAGREKEGEFVQFHLWYFHLIKVSDVPQASVLGALLFSIYVNDLPNVSQNCSMAHYVDDTKLLLSFTENSSVHVIESVISNLQWIHNWCFDNWLMLNPDKTWLMVFGSQQMCSKLLDFWEKTTQLNILKTLELFVIQRYLLIIFLLRQLSCSQAKEVKETTRSHFSFVCWKTTN